MWVIKGGFLKTRHPRIFLKEDTSREEEDEKRNDLWVGLHPLSTTEGKHMGVTGYVSREEGETYKDSLVVPFPILKILGARSSTLSNSAGS